MRKKGVRRAAGIFGLRLRSAADRFGRAVARRERLWLGLSLAAVLIVLGGFLALHIALSAGLVPGWINTDPAEFRLVYDSASSWVPGLVRVRGLTLSGSDPNIEWSARMEEATIRVSLVELLLRRFHATSVRARGLTFRLRERLAPGEVSPAHVQRLPEIPGFSDPPLAPKRGTTPAAAGRGPFWTVLIENLVADPTREIWIDLYRFQGSARVTGSFLIHPHARAWVGPAAVRLLAGTLTLGPDQPLLADSSGLFEAVIAPYDTERVRGDDVWPFIRGTARLEGHLTDLRFLNHFLRLSREPRLQGGGGTAKIDLRFLRGIGTGRVDFQVPRVSAVYGRESLSGRAVGRFAIRRWDQQHGQIDLSGSRIDLADIATAGAPRESRDWWGRFDFDQALVSNGLDARARVSCRDARPLYTLLRAKLPGWAEGILKLDGLQASARVRLAHDLVDVRNLDATGGKFHLAGRYRELKVARSGAFLVETGSLAVGIEIDGGASKVRLLGARRWFEDAAGGDSSPPVPK